MSGAEDWDGSARLSKRSRVGGVGVHNTTDGFEGKEQTTMRRRIRGRTQVAFDLVSIEIHQHHHLGSERVIVYARGFDGEDAAVAIDGGGVAEGEVDQALFG